MKILFTIIIFIVSENLDANVIQKNNTLDNSLSIENVIDIESEEHIDLDKKKVKKTKKRKPKKKRRKKRKKTKLGKINQSNSLISENTGRATKGIVYGVIIVVFVAFSVLIFI